MPCNKSPSSFRETGTFPLPSAHPFVSRQNSSCRPETDTRPNDEVDESEDNVCHFFHLLSCPCSSQRACPDGSMERRGFYLIGRTGDFRSAGEEGGVGRGGRDW